MKRSLLLAAGLVASVLVLSACAGGATGYAYVLNGRTTTQASVDKELKAIAGNKQFEKAISQQSQGTKLTNTDGSINSEISAAWLNALVQYRAYEQAVQKQGIKVSAADKTQAKSQAEQLFGGAPVFAAFPKWFRALELEREAKKVAYVRSAAKLPTDAETRAYFEQNKATLCPSGKVVSHILVKTQAEAEAIETQLASGADFATIARSTSTDTQSGARGGLLGCLGAQQLVPQFQQAADALALGQISPPVQTQFGWHVISVTALTYEIAKSSVESALGQQEQQRIAALIGDRLAKGKLKVNPRYGHLQRTRQGLQIVPPTPPKVRNKPSPSSTPSTPAVPSTPATPTPTG